MTLKHYRSLKSLDQFRNGRVSNKVAAKRERVLEFIKSYKKSNDGAMPGHREISSACEIKSTSNVASFLEQLTRTGDLYVNERGRLCVRGGQWNMTEPAEIETKPGTVLMIVETKPPFEFVAARLERP